jgi:hypothetical protein
MRVIPPVQVPVPKRAALLTNAPIELEHVQELAANSIPAKPECPSTSQGNRMSMIL